MQRLTQRELVEWYRFYKLENEQKPTTPKKSEKELVVQMQTGLQALNARNSGKKR